MSLSVRVIPCLDVDNGRVVKGVNFLDLVDAGDPVELAARYGEQGADEITFLDVTATVDNRATTLDLVRQTAENVFIPLTVGGGVRSVIGIYNWYLVIGCFSIEGRLRACVHVPGTSSRNWSGSQRRSSAAEITCAKENRVHTLNKTLCRTCDP